MDSNKMLIRTQCKRCGKMIKLRVYPNDLQDYYNGTPVNDAFPYLSDDQKEILNLGMCPDCWNYLMNNIY